MPTSDTWSNGSGSTKGAGALHWTRAWARTANFKQIAEWDLPMQSYDDTRWRVSQSYFAGAFTYYANGSVVQLYAPQYTTTYSDLESSAYGVFLQDLSLGHYDGSAMLNEQLVKALVKIADAKVNLAVTIAEAGKTADLILDSARRIYGAYRAFRRGDLKGIARNLNITPKRLHKSWLEYKYGWMPLLMDVKGAAEAFAQSQVGRPIRFSVSSKGLWKYSRTWKSGTIPNAHNHPIVINYSSTSSVTRRVKIWVEITNPRMSYLQQLGLTNPALVAWELVPFSFVFDWFISVGDWLTGLTALHGVSVKKAMESQLSTGAYAWNYPSTYKTDGGGSVETCDGQQALTTLRSYSRRSLEVNPLSTYPPRNNANLGFQKLVTSLALLRSTRVI